MQLLWPDYAAMMRAEKVINSSIPNIKQYLLTNAYFNIDELKKKDL